MHPDFLEAAEASLDVGTAGARASGCDTHFWYVLAYEDQRPVGAACVTEYPLDTMVFASPLAQRVVANVRRVFPSYLKFRITFCGLPISTAGSNLRVAAGADFAAVIGALNGAVEQIARERKTWLIVYKELDERETQLAAPLEGLRFVRTESLPMNRIHDRLAGFSEFIDSMRSHYRYKIARSRKKFARSGLKLERTTGRAVLEEIYTPALHAMYERVARRAEHRLEILPREYFLELAARFPNELVLTTIMQGADVIAFAWSMRHGAVYRNLFVGIDYNRNEEHDAYFNLMIEDIAHAMAEPVDEIMVGQTADEFKSRLGCTSDPRYLFVKVTSRLLQWWFRRFQSSFFPPLPPAPRRDVFNHESQNSTATPLRRSFKNRLIE
jgi:hypothetical protein